MKKKSLKNLAFLGLASGLLAAQQVEANQQHSSPLKTELETGQSSQFNTGQSSQFNSDDPNAGNLGYHLMTEEELLLELNDDGTKLYNSLDAEGKLLAREVASMRCNASNKCRGLNACRTEANECAGKGECKGQGKCAIADKNFAVKLVAEKMAAKRAKAQQPAK